jgi:GAF domain-containing protein
VRRFAAIVDGEIAAYCDLYSDGRTGQIESVGTLPEHRNRGLARAVVTKAGEEAGALGCDLVFLVADPKDWPQELYRKLGFDDAGLLHRFHLTPATIVERLLREMQASRVTLRQNLPGEVLLPITHEALAEGVESIRDGAGVDLRGQPVVRALDETRAQVVQDDAAAASPDPAFQRMREAYGGLGAQIVTPVLRDGRLVGALSVHHLGGPRRWTRDELALAARAAEAAARLVRA